VAGPHKLNISSPTTPHLIECVTTVEEAIVATLPTGVGQRNHKVFLLGVHLRSLAAEGTSADAFRSVVEDWHRRARSVVRTKRFSETWKEFKYAWRRIKVWPVSMRKAIVRADQIPTPAIGLTFSDERQRHLLRLCASLQELWGEEPFFLSARMAAAVIQTYPMQAHRWLSQMKDRGILRQIAIGRLAGLKATTWLYLGG
jgi:hypothetical protein